MVIQAVHKDCSWNLEFLLNLKLFYYYMKEITSRIYVYKKLLWIKNHCSISNLRGKKNPGFSHNSPYIKQTFKLKGFWAMQRLCGKRKGKDIGEHVKKKRCCWFRKREYEVRNNREEEGKKTEWLSSFQQQQINLEISFHASLIVLIKYSSASYFLVEDLKILSFIQVQTWRNSISIYVLCICTSILKRIWVLAYTYMVSN